MTAEEFKQSVAQIVDEVDSIGTQKAAFTNSDERPNRGADLWFHFEGRIPEVTVQCIRWLQKTSQCMISVECEKPDRAGLEELARSADVVFYSRSWAAARGYADAESCVRKQAKSTGA
jgi:hypothetical protein